MGVTSCATLPFLPGTHVFSTVFKLLQANSTLFKHLWLVTPADNIYGLDSYSLGDHVRYFPMTESDPGRAMKKLLHIEPAKITAESEAARFKPESGK